MSVINKLTETSDIGTVDAWHYRKMTKSASTNIVLPPYPFSFLVIEEFVLDTFERVIMMKGVDAKDLPLFIEFLRNHQPEGLLMSADSPDPDLENFRYIPDMEMTVLQRKLDDLDSGKIDSLSWKK